MNGMESSNNGCLDNIIGTSDHDFTQNGEYKDFENAVSLNVPTRQKSIKMAHRKTIALIAHDKYKPNLIKWCQKWKHILKEYYLIGTGTTSKKINKETGLDVQGMLSGPDGGDQQIGARIAEHRCDFLCFFWDPTSAAPHDHDVKALFRIATLYDVLIATNPSTADMVISNPVMSCKKEG
ncbi:methylglyoxal synthase-like [Clytia hemisphaerica]|uniref:MGS-like domain-containing protein n=1 Tax=Clytia hemisphaerica TaxID=252671 RepID=A0A7M5URJ9_9CNID|eukprot:TCONS_00006713-protein